MLWIYGPELFASQLPKFVHRKVDLRWGAIRRNVVSFCNEIKWRVKLTDFTVRRLLHAENVLFSRTRSRHISLPYRDNKIRLGNMNEICATHLIAVQNCFHLELLSGQRRSRQTKLETAQKPNNEDSGNHQKCKGNTPKKWGELLAFVRDERAHK